jgi:hypothetical protein
MCVIDTLFLNAEEGIAAGARYDAGWRVSARYTIVQDGLVCY